MKFHIIFNVLLITSLLIIGHSKEVYSQTDSSTQSAREIAKFIADATIFSYELVKEYSTPVHCMRQTIREGGHISMEYLQTQLESLSISYLIYLLNDRTSSEDLSDMQKKVQRLQTSLDRLESHLHRDCPREDRPF